MRVQCSKLEILILLLSRVSAFFGLRRVTHTRENHQILDIVKTRLEVHQTDFPDVKLHSKNNPEVENWLRSLIFPISAKMGLSHASTQKSKSAQKPIWPTKATFL